MVRADRVRADLASASDRAARHESTPASGVARELDAAAALRLDDFRTLVGAPLRAVRAPATCRPCRVRLRGAPPPTLLHRDWRVFGVEVPVDLDDKHTSLDAL